MLWWPLWWSRETGQDTDELVGRVIMVAQWRGQAAADETNRRRITTAGQQRETPNECR